MYDAIKQEIERRMDYHYDKLPDADSPEDDWTHNELCELGAYKELEHLETFIESLEKEQLQRLDEAAEEYAYRGIKPEYHQAVKPLADEIIKHFKAGAKWMIEHQRRTN